MAGRYKEAQAEFSAPVVADDPASSLWRGYVDAKLNQWSDARGEFQKGAPAWGQFTPRWRARFAREDAEAALALNDTKIAAGEVQAALDNAGGDPIEQLAVRLVQARLIEAEGDKPGALKVYDAISTVNLPWLSAPALLHATQIRLAQGALQPNQAADILDGLRYRWRGDATELETIRTLSQIYLSMGRYREALDALRSAGQHLPDLPEAIDLENDLNNAFRNLFLNGQADGLQPVQALALFYDFKDLTPIGADGDLIVRKLARRLVDVDLLGQAAELLKYQEENRLDGVPKAEVAADLATIDVMNRQPEAALDALNEFAQHALAHLARRPEAGDRGARLADARPIRPCDRDHRRRQVGRCGERPRRSGLAQAGLVRLGLPARGDVGRSLEGSGAALHRR